MAAAHSIRPEAPGRVTRALRLAGVLLAGVTVVAELARVWVDSDDLGHYPLYAGLGAGFLVLFALVVLRPPRAVWAAHAALAVQCLLVLAMLSLNGGLDYVTTLFVPLAFEAALLFEGRTAWVWIGALAALTIGSLISEFGVLQAVALGLVPAAAEVVFAAYVVVVRDIEGARLRSQTLLEELQVAQGRLDAYAAQAGELAALGERDRVAGELNESAARTIRGVLAAAEEARALLAGAEVPGGPAGDAGGGTGRRARRLHPGGHAARPRPDAWPHRGIAAAGGRARGGARRVRARRAAGGRRVVSDRPTVRVRAGRRTRDLRPRSRVSPRLRDFVPRSTARMRPAPDARATPLPEHGAASDTAAPSPGGRSCPSRSRQVWR